MNTFKKIRLLFKEKSDFVRFAIQHDCDPSFIVAPQNFLKTYNDQNNEINNGIDK